MRETVSKLGVCFLGGGWGELRAVGGVTVKVTTHRMRLVRIQLVLAMPGGKR